jgi:hypothetical protein
MSGCDPIYEGLPGLEVTATEVAVLEILFDPDQNYKDQQDAERAAPRITNSRTLVLIYPPAPLHI